jgi:hypothetical protein
MHLNTEELVDIAEGTRPEASLPHLAACEPCRAQLRDLRAMMSAAQEVEVPEPSPLFWDHLSSRVHDAVVEAGPPPARQWRFGVPRRSSRDVVASEGREPSRFVFVASRWFQASLAVAAGLLLAVAVNLRAPAPAPLPAPPSVAIADASAPAELLSDVAADDASLTLVASLTDQVDLETAREAGLAPRGSADHAIAHLSDSELRELGRLLREELARSGA